MATTTTQREYDVGELQDLIKAKDADTSGDYSGFQALQERWSVQDPTAEGQWLSDWNTMISAYNSAKAAAGAAVLEAKALADLTTFGLGSYTDMNATSHYNDVLTSLNSAALSNTVAPGSFDDLDGRLRTIAAQLQVPLAANIIPQPTPSFDSGLNPKSWEGYVTGLGAKLGWVDPADVPPGTPGTTGGPPLFPTWLKVSAGLALGAVIVAKVREVFT